MPGKEVYSTADVAKLTGNDTWTIRRIVHSQQHVRRLGRAIVIFSEDLPKILEALEKRGYPCKLLKAS